MAKQTIFTKLNTTYLCEINHITIITIQKRLGINIDKIDVEALVLLCNYFKIDMDKYVFSNLQKLNQEI